MFEVRFIRSDSDCQESYFYHKEQEALSHYNTRFEGDTDLYLAVQLLSDTTLLTQHIFGFSAQELHLLKEIATCDQFDTCLFLYRLAEKEHGHNYDDLVSLRLRVASIEYDRFPVFFRLLNI